MSNEIGLLRINVDHFMEAYTTSLEKLDYENRLAGLRAITMAVGLIASLERIQPSAGKNAEEANKLREQIMNLLYDTNETSDQVQE